MTASFKSLYPTTIKERDVYYFSTDKISSASPHYFVCIKKDANNILVFSCGTTQQNKREAYLEYKGYSLKTLVYIDPSKSGANFTKDTFVDCNNCTIFTLEEFTKICKEKEIEYKGELDEVYYEQILIGIHESTEIEEKLKEIIPKPEDL